MFHLDRKYPAGTHLTVSGEYRTNSLAFGKDGQVFTSLMCCSVKGNEKQPKAWLNAILEPSETWKKFTVSKRLPFAIETIHLNSALWNTQGTVDFRSLSLQFERPSQEPDRKMEFAWREAEAIERIQPANNWGKNIAADYYSGKGGIALVKKNLDWNFQIIPVVDPVTLFEKARSWHLWMRVYGYLGSPRIMIHLNDRFMSYIDPPANEQTTPKDEYAGPGEYIWVWCGSFTTKGGNQQLSIRPKDRMLIDALLLTTDEKYTPVKYEARDIEQAKVIDITTTHMIKAEYAEEGVTDQIVLPISFRCAGKNLKIPENADPAIFHFSLPESIHVETVSSHFAGTQWNSSGHWGNKYLTWHKVGTRTVNGKQICDYQAKLYYLSGNQYLVFVKADPVSFKPGTKSVCEYWLEHHGEKQLPEKIELTHIEILPAKPFKKIYIGPSYLPFAMFYRSCPDVFKTMNDCGFNYMGSWWTPWQDKDCDAFRDEAYAKGFRLSTVIAQYTGIRDIDIAIGLDGNPVSTGSGSGTKIVSLALDAVDPPIAETLERTKFCAATGISIEYDDEMTNVLGDRIDYSPEIKSLFREWLVDHGNGIAYQDPVQIVKAKKSNPLMYGLWVDFKCSRLAYWYSLYHKAFEEGVALADGKYPEAMKPLLLTCIQGASMPNAEKIRETNYLDYRLLSQYCDVIQIMSYTYKGVVESAKPGDALEMYNRYIGKNCTAPILLAGGYGTETTLENKVMLKYQIFESLMQKAPMIVFYAGATIFNAPTLAPVVEAIRIAGPYEDFFVDGERYEMMTGNQEYLRLKALRLGKKILLYASNYANDPEKQVTVRFPADLKSVSNCATDEKLSTTKDSFSFDFQTDRGKLFLVEL
ncbi:MAG: hypothetical protein WCT05_09255 [Lentisphaeria bacterium]